MLPANMEIVHRFLTSLVFTDCIETIVLIVLLRYAFKMRRMPIKQMVFAGLYASFSTISYVWFVFPYVFYWQSMISIFYAELFAFIVEAVFYRWVLKLDWRVAFFVSFVCNMVSYALGPFLRAHGIWLYW